MKRLKARLVCGSVPLIGLRVFAVHRRKAVRDVLHLAHRQRRVEPHMCVVHAVIMVMSIMIILTAQHLDAVARVDDRQFRALGDHLVHELLHAAAVDDERVRALQRDHVARLQLIIVQAAGALARHIHHAHARHIPDHVLREHIHRIKRGDDRLPRIFLRRAAAAHCQRKRQQRGEHALFHLYQSFRRLIINKHNPSTIIFSRLISFFLPAAVRFFVYSSSASPELIFHALCVIIMITVLKQRRRLPCLKRLSSSTATA